jgi:hypothetical protein
MGQVITRGIDRARAIGLMKSTRSLELKSLVYEEALERIGKRGVTAADRDTARAVRRLLQRQVRSGDGFRARVAPGQIDMFE